MRSAGRCLLGACLALLLLAGTAAAQQLPLKTEVPERRIGICPALDAPDPGLVTEADRQEAARLTTSATQAAIIGDHQQARSLLRRAARLDPQDADVAYLLARASDEVADRDGALREYCRYLELSPDAPEAAEVQVRIADLAPDGGQEYTEQALRQFRLGVNNFQFGRIEPAEVAFTAALEEAPEWPEAYYNRALAYARLEQPALARSNLERYLALVPDAQDADAVRAAIDQLANPVARYSAGTAFAAGIFPGGGHFYTGRPVVGSLVLGAVGGLVAFGLLSEDIVIECRSIPVNNVCPPGDVAGEERTRPYLVPALGAAGALTLAAAIEAWRGAGRSGTGVGSLVQVGAVDGPRLRVPAVSAGPNGTRIELFRWTF
ncbi:MAG: tetratricopeptide repeat protein [Gemmatimonadota bacterium]|nr:tetratricopeptide repeat protein [Gemmatimonadota bacterium]